MEMAIADLLAKGAVKKVEPQDDQVTSTKKNHLKKNIPVINLWALNLLFPGRGVIQDGGLQVVWSLIQQDDFMIKLDLKDAYIMLFKPYQMHTKA